MQEKIILKSISAFAVLGAIGFFLGNPLSASAQTQTDPPDLGWGTPVKENAGPDCFDYYHFQSVQVSLGAEKDKYPAGEKVKFSGQLINENEYPVFDGHVFVRISQINQAKGQDGAEKYLTEYHYIIDEFIAQKDIALNAKEEKPFSFEWPVPAGVAAGQYRADFFFSVGRKFNLGGLPFSNEVVVGASEFEIESTVKDYLSFSRSHTTVNGEPYAQIGNWPQIEGDQDITIVHQLENSFDDDQKVNLTWELYYWDALNEKDKVTTKEQEMTVPANSSLPITFTFKQEGKSVYYLKTIAKSENQQSIVNTRISTEKEMPRLNYPGINKFPLKKDEAATLFSCFHNTNNLNTQGKVEVILKDREGKIVEQFAYQGDISSAMMAQKKDFSANKDYDYLTIDAKVYDKAGKLVDAYQTIYDCQKINKCFAKSAEGSGLQSDGKKILTLIIIGLMAAGGAVLAIYLFRKKNQKII